MRRRSRAGGQRTKAQRGKPAALKRRNAPKSGSHRLPPAHQETEVARLAHELNEAREQQAATADVLKVISRSTFDLQTVLDTLVESAARLCEADIAAIIRQKGSANYWATSYGLPPEHAEYIKNIPLEPGRGTVTGRVLLEGKTVHIADVLADQEYAHPEVQRRTGHRTVLAIPLVREEVPIGIILLMRRSVLPFTDKQIELVTTFADQAVIAIENVRLFEAEQQRTRELAESLEQQTATSEVLSVISSSPGRLEPVFQTMLDNAVHICQAKFGFMNRYEVMPRRLSPSMVRPRPIPNTCSSTDISGQDPKPSLRASPRPSR